MMRSLLLLSCVGAAIYALLVATNEKMPVAPDGTKAEFVARETRLKVWGPYLPNRPLKQLAATKQVAPPPQTIPLGENAAVRAAPATADQTATSSSHIGERLASFETGLPASDHEPIWFVVSRAARLHDGPSVSSPIVHLYPVGAELRSIDYPQGWFRVLDPTTSRTGWIYERYYLHVIPRPGQTTRIAQDSPPTRVAVLASDLKPVGRIKNPRPQQKFAKQPKQKFATPKRDQRVRLASARADESVASIMERAFRRN
jgi:hypothetical protein